MAYYLRLQGGGKLLLQGGGGVLLPYSPLPFSGSGPIVQGFGSALLVTQGYASGSAAPGLVAGSVTSVLVASAGVFADVAGSGATSTGFGEVRSLLIKSTDTGIATAHPGRTLNL